MADSVYANSGRGCINCSGIWASRHTKEIAQALAERIGPIVPKPPDDPESSLAAFTVPGQAQSIHASILAKIKRMGPITINALARELVMDRTTLGRNILPLERDGLITIEKGASDARSKELRLTRKGAARLGPALKRWAEAARGAGRRDRRSAGRRRPGS